MAKKIKIKTHSGAKKRFNISKNGKVKYQKTNRRHRRQVGIMDKRITQNSFYHGRNSRNIRAGICLDRFQIIGCC